MVQTASEGWLDRVDDRLASMPAWARPPFYGMLFVYALVLPRAGALLPLLVIGAVIAGGFEAAMYLAWLAVAVGLAGFAGGLAFAVLRPLLQGLGRVGALMTGWGTVFVYLVTVLPLVNPRDPRSRHHVDLGDPASWVITVLLSALFGTILAGIFLEPARGAKRRRWVQRVQRRTSRV